MTKDNDLGVTVVHANELTESIYNLDIYEIRLIAFACSKINSKKNKPARITVSPLEFAGLFNLPTTTIHKLLKNAVKSLASKYVVLVDKKDNNKERVITWLSEGDYERNPTTDNSEVNLTFSPAMQPYLYDLNKFYTAINFEIVTKLNTPFANRLYQWLCLDRYLDKSKIDGFFTRTLDVNWMKKRAAIPDNYTWQNFFKRHINPAIERINSLNDIYINKPEFIKSGKNITAVKFTCIEEKRKDIKPLRPRLLKRPKVEKGSHAEGKWMRSNIKLLTTYRNELLAYDKTLKLSLPDLRKLHDYHLALGEKDKAAFYKKEIEARTPAKKIKVEKMETAEEKLLRYAKELGVKVSLEKP